MNAIFFGVKRAHHAVLRVTRRRLARFGLTAARFDMLWAIHSDSDCLQRKLRRRLGVSGATISRMLRALEALGLVKREVDMDDARQRLVMLTDEGAARIKAAHAEITEGGVAQRLLDYALGGPRRDREERAFWAMCELEEYLDAMRSAFRDRAWLYYPWHPDD